MHLTEFSNWIYPLLVLMGGVVGYFVFRSTYAKESGILKDDLIDTRGKKIEDLEETVQALQERDDEQQRMIDELQRELQTWKNLPIKQLADDYHKLATAYSEMSQILKALLEEKK